MCGATLEKDLPALKYRLAFKSMPAGYVTPRSFDAPQNL